MNNSYILRESEIRLKLAEGRSLYSSVPLSNPDIAVDTMAGLLRELDHEVACVVNLDTRLRPINFTVIGVGNQNSCPVPVSNIFKSALLSGASSIMLLHNHPSGDVTPSQEDLDVTRKLILAGNLMECPLTDHIIIGGMTGEYYSIRSDHHEIDFREAPAVIQEKKQLYEKKKRRGR